MSGLHNRLTTCFLVVYIAQKPIYYGANDINVFQGTRLVSQIKSMIIVFLILKGSIVWAIEQT